LNIAFLINLIGLRIFGYQLLYHSDLFTGFKVWNKIICTPFAKNNKGENHYYKHSGCFYGIKLFVVPFFDDTGGGQPVHTKNKSKANLPITKACFLWLLPLLSRVSQYSGPYFNHGTVKSQVHLRTETEMSHESLQNNRLLTPEALQNNSAHIMSKIRRTGEEERRNNFANTF